MIRAFAEGVTKPRYKSSTCGYGTGLLRSSPLHTSFLSSMAYVCTREDRTHQSFTRKEWKHSPQQEIKTPTLRQKHKYLVQVGNFARVKQIIQGLTVHSLEILDLFLPVSYNPLFTKFMRLKYFSHDKEDIHHHCMFF